MSEYVFKREVISRFHFHDCRFDAATGIASLDYRFDSGSVFTETVSFPGAPFTLDDVRTQAVQAALQTLHLIAGVSYYKAAVPKTLVIDQLRNRCRYRGIDDTDLREWPWRIRLP